MGINLMRFFGKGGNGETMPIHEIHVRRDSRRLGFHLLKHAETLPLVKSREKRGRFDVPVGGDKARSIVRKS